MKPSANEEMVRQWFGIGEIEPARSESPPFIADLPLAPGTITLIAGPSGAGKTTLMRRVRRQRRRSIWINVNRVHLPDALVVDCFGNEQLETVLSILGRVGLGEVWTYLRKPRQLSEGQRRRLRWAIALARAGQTAAGAPVILAADEFCSALDAITARILSRCLRRAIDDAPHVAVLLATSRADLEPALRPNVVVSCDFGYWILH